MRNVTRAYFPHGRDMQQYLDAVATSAALQIEFGVDVVRVASSDDGGSATLPCVMWRPADSAETASTHKYCAARRIFVATGLKERRQPVFEALGAVPYSQAERSAADGRTVCIIGNGNAGSEVAQNTFDIAERVMLWGRRPQRISAVTKYTGDVRIKYLQTLENFHAKLRDTNWYFLRAAIRSEHMTTEEINVIGEIGNVCRFLKEYNCEYFVYATGFESSVPAGLGFDQPCRLTAADDANSSKCRFPPMADWYESTVVPNVHFVGWLMHASDFRRGSGGFVAGYRYLIRSLVDHVQEVDVGVPFPRKTLNSLEEAVQHAMSRIQRAADIVIMQDGVVLRDMIVPTDEQDRWTYYEGVPFNFFGDLATGKGVVHMYFAYGDGRRSATVFDGFGRYTDSLRLINLFLHPVLVVDGVMRHIMEDIEMTWQQRQNRDAAERAVRAALTGNLDDFSPVRDAQPFAFGHFPMTDSAIPYEDGTRTDLNGWNATFARFVLDAIRAPTSEEALLALRQEARHNVPAGLQKQQ
eukprot:TRINITY_DN582_c0_g1_i2.p1 TRINITY_DN582_c0_g1~~TRINITY_DN582_c0_g1_i2.p1  ORF type:complete len:525 (-),score=116.51 TRINITY_DN582_c0_g1_i2:18-1592(-)